MDKNRKGLVILGVDPGAKETGLALIEGDAVLDHFVASRPRVTDLVDPLYAAYVLKAADVLLDGLTQDLDAVAIEDLRAPNPHVRVTNPGPAIAAGVIAGALIGWADRRGVRVVTVSPEGLGSRLLATYPKTLVGPRETSGRGGVLRHARSAYDVALAARFRLRIPIRDSLTR